MADRPLIDASDLRRWERYCSAAPERGVKAMCRAVNAAGNKARTQVISALAKEMGLSYGKVKDQIRTFPARDTPVYELRARGGYISLRAFGAVQRKKGVSARPWGKRRLFRSTFIVRKLNSQVFRRATAQEKAAMSARAKARRKETFVPIVKMWGPALPKEMVDATVSAEFERVGRSELPVALAHHMGHLFPDFDWAG